MAKNKNKLKNKGNFRKLKDNLVKSSETKQNNLMNLQIKKGSIGKRINCGLLR